MYCIVTAAETTRFVYYDYNYSSIICIHP